MSLHYAVVFDNEYAAYYAGQTITGRVLVELSKPKKLKGILFRIKGSAHVRWSETEGAGKNRRSVSYYGNEEYFKSKHYCIIGRDNDPFILEPGSYSYPISFILPPTLPSSFEGLYGHIRYTASVTLERPWKFNLENKVAFTVISPYDLRMFPNLLSPGKISEDKFFCCWCCKKGPLTAIISVPKLGYVPGETIPVTIEIDNITNINIQEIKLHLLQYTEFHSQHPRHKVRHEFKEVLLFTLGTLGPRNSKTLTQSVLIPALPPTNVNNCSLIDSRYEIMLQLETGTFHINLRARLPIVIGTIPIFEQGNSHINPLESAPPNYDTAMENYPGPGPSREGWNVNLDLPAPGFYENKMFSVKSLDDYDDDSGNTQSNKSDGYTPRYPMYNFNTEK